MSVQHYGPKSGWTTEGGFAILMTNRTGGNTVKGYIVQPDAANDDGFVHCAIDEPDIIGVVYEAGVANGSEAWVVVAGIAEVYYMNAVSREWYGRNRAGAEGGSAGQAIGEVVPGSPFATDKHFQEIGHIIQATGGAGLARTVLHFN